MRKGKSYHNRRSPSGTSAALALNFVGTTTLDPRITFSRGTNATLTDSNGRIAWAPHNLLTNSEDFEAAAWVNNGGTVTSNALVAPDGSTTADYLVRSTGAADGRYQTITAGTSGVVTASVYIKKDTSPQSLIWLYDATAVADRLFATVTWSGSTPVITATTGTAATPQDAGNGWWRIAITSTALTGANTNRLYLLPAYTAASNGQQAVFWGAQLNVGSTAQSYNSTTPKNLLGFTQEPENAAWTKSNSYVQQNLLTWSEDFSNAAWALDNGAALNPVVTANAGVAPNGSTTADRIVFNRTGGTFSRIQQSAVSTIGLQYTFSVWMKTFTAGTTANVGIRVDLNGVNCVVTENWTRFTVTTTTTAGSTAGQILLFSSIPGNDLTADVLVWGAQLVQGSTAGDYTQTTSAAAPTRYLNFDGTLTGRKLVENTVNAWHGVSQTGSTGLVGIFSFYAQAAERSRVWVGGDNPDFAVAVAVFNLANGTVQSGAGTITPAGGGWYRCSVQATISARGCTIAVADNSGVVIRAGDGTSGIYVSDFQLSNSASVDPYVYNPQAAAASAAYYGPRFDYNPVTLASNGLLIEEQRTNLLTYSEQFDNAAWTKVQLNTTGTPAWVNVATAPDGSTTTDKLIATNVASDHTVVRTDVTGANTYTLSVFAKASEYSFLALWLFQATTVKGVLFNVSTGAFVSHLDASNQVTSYNVTPVGNGYFRLTITATLTLAQCGISISDSAAPSFTASRLPTFTGDNTSGVFVWGAQLEQGTFSTSYIPTVASQVTRNADSASMLGDNFYTWYNPNQGTLSGEATFLGRPASVGNARVAVVSDGTTNNLISAGLRNNAASPGMYYGQVITGGVTQALLPGASAPDVGNNTTFRSAVAYKTDDIAATGNGATPATDLTATIPVVNRLFIGSIDGAGNIVNGTIRRIGYYNTRLPDSTLTALTT